MLSEAGRNLSTGTTRAALFAVVLALAAFALAIADARSVLSLERQAQDFHSAGGATYVLHAESSVSGAACDSLNQIEGIEASGALRTVSDRLTFAAAPNSPVPVAHVTARFSELLDSSTTRPQASGLLLSSEVADAMLASNATSLQTTAMEEAQVAGVFVWPRDGPLQSLSYVALSPVVASGVFDECWVTVWPPSEETADLITSALLPGASAGSASVSQVNASLGQEFDGPGLFALRDTRWTPWLGVAVGVLAGYMSVRLRRLELASARHCGVTPTTALAQAMVETSIWAAAAFCLAAGPLALVIAQESSGVHEVVLISVRPILTASLGAVCGAAAATLTIKKSHLLRYFKDR